MEDGPARGKLRLTGVKFLESRGLKRRCESMGFRLSGKEETMYAGYFVGRWIKSKLNSWGYNSVVSWLAGKVGQSLAKKIVSKVVSAGATGAAGWIASMLGASGALAGVFGWLVGAGAGWL